MKKINHCREQIEDFIMSLFPPTPETSVPQWENGRVTGLSGHSFAPLPMTTDDHNRDNKFKDEALRGILERDKLSMLYFSKPNMDNIQNQIRYNVWLRSNKRHVIGHQNTLDLEVVMRSIYLQYALHLNCRYKEQIERLNQLVVDWCVPKILVEVEQHMAYLDQVQAQPVPIDLPQNLSTAGTKMLRSITSTF